MIKKINTFENFKKYLRKFKVSDIILRKDIIFKKIGWHVTIDNYRNHFTLAGYLKIIGRGKYRLIRLIPEKLSARELRRQAYKNSYLNWHEYAYLKK